MSDLSAQLSAFKNKLKNGPSVIAARRPIGIKSNNNNNSTPPTPRSTNLSNSTSSISSPSSRNGNGSGTKRSNESVTDILKRQKLSNDGNLLSGSHLATYLLLATEYIKQYDHPIPVSKLSDYLSFDVHLTLMPLFKEIDRINYDPEADTIQYVSLHNIRSPEDLLNFLRGQITFKGTPVKDLKDGWAGCIAAINSLEEENKILVLRNKKENAPRMIWINEGPKLGSIDDEYKVMWNDVKLPDPDNLYQSLIDQGLKPTGADPNLIKKKPQQQEKKQKKARRGKITNTHMKGILKDYSQLV
ncbi:TFIIE beta subunit core domain-containing protein [Scheffersomyces amazonensis]|uniref:TFIIE beta subunit core domain-containing protein n=1 Tax=Scheffersomyces amazonensis TaxID=1078765 RepID=UPI00315D7930